MRRSSTAPLFELPQCVLCLESLSQDMIFLQCGHVFHKKCGMQFFTVKKECPCCRKTIAAKEIMNNNLFFKAESKKIPNALQILKTKQQSNDHKSLLLKIQFLEKQVEIWKNLKSNRTKNQDLLKNKMNSMINQYEDSFRMLSKQNSVQLQQKNKQMDFLQQCINVQKQQYQDIQKMKGSLLQQIEKTKKEQDLQMQKVQKLKKEKEKESQTLMKINSLLITQVKNLQYKLRIQREFKTRLEDAEQKNRILERKLKESEEIAQIFQRQMQEKRKP